MVSGGDIGLVKRTYLFGIEFRKAIFELLLLRSKVDVRLHNSAVELTSSELPGMYAL